MEQVIDYFESINPILAALYATLFTWGLTALGASLVFLFKTMNRAVLDGMLGFTGGVMVAASFWSLLAPGIEMSPGEGFVKVIPAAIGFLLGAAFIFGLDKILPHVHINFKETEGIKTPWHRTTLLTLAITLHNIPEGLAVGVLFGGVAAGFEGANIGGAVALALGIGLQNFPEGFAVAMPLTLQIGRRRLLDQCRQRLDGGHHRLAFAAETADRDRGSRPPACRPPASPGPSPANARAPCS